MMNAEQLTEYKKGLENDIKNMENGFHRIKLELDSKKKMLKLVESQLEEVSSKILIPTADILKSLEVYEKSQQARIAVPELSKD